MDNKEKREYARISMAIKRNKSKGLEYNQLITLRNKLIKKEKVENFNKNSTNDSKNITTLQNRLLEIAIDKFINEINESNKNSQNNKEDSEFFTIVEKLNFIITKQEKLETLISEYHSKTREIIDSLLLDSFYNNKRITSTNKLSLENSKKIEKKSERIRSRRFDQNLISRVENLKGVGSFTNAIIEALDYYKEKKLSHNEFSTYEIKERTLKNKDFKVYPRTKEIFESIPEEKRLNVISHLIEKSLK